ncbi:uncharacterized protein LOC127034586 [Gopherus flavomarginatus]|uniref:uncharacterized protein LOC127034586 n=1 Tax=Gopherus flavomarginatus TaxID=286002 RepID=UPI0021CBCE87|nr:uncharacterized protein LOC127034586 [Gopherus flavomarginatus]
MMRTKRRRLQQRAQSILSPQTARIFSSPLLRFPASHLKAVLQKMKLRDRPLLHISLASLSLLIYVGGGIIRRLRKRRTREDMFTEIMAVTRTERAQQGDWKQLVAKYREAASQREDRRDQREDRRDAKNDVRWQEDQRWRAATLDLLRDQTDILRDMLQELRGFRMPLQPVYNLPQYSPCPTPSRTRRVRTRGGRLSAPAPSTAADTPTRRLSLD